MTRVAVTVIGTNLVMDYGTEEAAREAMDSMAASPTALDVIEGLLPVRPIGSHEIEAAGGWVVACGAYGEYGCMPTEVRDYIVAILNARLTEQETDDDDGSLGWDMGGSEPGPAYRAAPPAALDVNTVEDILADAESDGIIGPEYTPRRLAQYIVDSLAPDEAAPPTAPDSVTLTADNRIIVGGHTLPAWVAATIARRAGAAPRAEGLDNETMNVLRDIDAALQWIADNYSEALVSMPTRLYRGLARAKAFVLRASHPSNDASLHVGDDS